MASMTDAFETKLLNLLFCNVNATNIGNATGLNGSSATGSTQLSLATVAYIDADTVLTADEATYQGYARAVNERNQANWTVSGDTVSNAGLIQFGQNTSSNSNTVVHVGLGFIATGNTIDLQADLTADLVVSTGVNPQFAIGALDWTAA